MQLAASQRTHPPPVPPRPNRQIIIPADGSAQVKNKVRPPCPTRQAPPPPVNARPWRVNNSSPSGPQPQQQQSQQDAKPKPPCRTIIYNSVSEQRPNQPANCTKDANNASEPVVNPLPRTKIDLSNGSLDYREESRLEYQVVVDPNENLKRANNHNVRFQEDNESQRSGDERGVRTVVVIDEEHDNNNIQRQDWLEAGVRYSSTKITLPSEFDSLPDEHTNGFWDEAYNEVGRVVVRENKDHGGKGQALPEKRTSLQNNNHHRKELAQEGITERAEKKKKIEETFVVVNDERDRGLLEDGAADDDDHDDDDDDHDDDDDDDAVEEADAKEDEVAVEAENQLEFADLDFSSILKRIAMSSLQGLPPLPRSLSGFNLNGTRNETGEPPPADPPPPPPARSHIRTPRTPNSNSNSLSSPSSRPSPAPRQLTTLDTQLAILRREMFGLRQLDLSLLSQLWSLNESIQEFRQLLQDQEDRAPSPSPSSEDGDDSSFGNCSQPPPPPRRPAPTMTPIHHQHHFQQIQQPQQQHRYQHRSSRSSRSSQLQMSDDSPSSEEYGAV